MLKINERPYGLLLFEAIALSLALVFLTNARSTFQDKSIFSVPLAVFVWAIPLFLMAFWILYLLTDRFLFSKRITWVHVLITVSTTILAVIIIYFVVPPLHSTLHNYLKSSGVEIMGKAARIVFFIFVFGQFTFITNVLLGLFTKVQ